MNYEYKTITLQSVRAPRSRFSSDEEYNSVKTAEALTDKINAMAKDGWELVSTNLAHLDIVHTIDFYLYFKRAVPDYGDTEKVKSNS